MSDVLPTEEKPVWDDAAAALRELAPSAMVPAGLRPLLMQAADEIERLVREVSRLMALMPEHDTRESYRCTECGAFHLRHPDVPERPSSLECTCREGLPRCGAPVHRDQGTRPVTTTRKP